LEFADTKTAHGVVPTALNRLPVKTARTTTGKRLQSESMIGKSSLSLLRLPCDV